MKLFKTTNTEIHPSDPAEEVDTIHRVMAHSANHRLPVFGAPTHCPDCGEWGMVDETTQQAVTNHCYLCGTRWVITRRALVTVAEQPRQLRTIGASGSLYRGDARANHPSNPQFSPGTSFSPTVTPHLRLAFDRGERVQVVSA